MCLLLQVTSVTIAVMTEMTEDTVISVMVTIATNGPSRFAIRW